MGCSLLLVLLLVILPQEIFAIESRDKLRKLMNSKKVRSLAAAKDLVGDRHSHVAASVEKEKGRRQERPASQLLRLQSARDNI